MSIDLLVLEDYVQIFTYIKILFLVSSIVLSISNLV
jgi:hypothetical protein